MWCTSCRHCLKIFHGTIVLQESKSTWERNKETKSKGPLTGRHLWKSLRGSLVSTGNAALNDGLLRWRYFCQMSVTVLLGHPRSASELAFSPHQRREIRAKLATSVATRGKAWEHCCLAVATVLLNQAKTHAARLVYVAAVNIESSWNKRWLFFSTCRLTGDKYNVNREHMIISC